MGVTFLLDSHVFLWLLGEPERISSDVLELLADQTNPLLVSAASAMEVSTKVRLGKLDSARNLARTWNARVEQIGASELPISAEHALFAGAYDWDHRDPFDRLLAGQAIVESVTFVSADTAMRSATGLDLLPC